MLLYTERRVIIVSFFLMVLSLLIASIYYGRAANFRVPLVSMS